MWRVSRAAVWPVSTWTMGRPSGASTSHAGSGGQLEYAYRVDGRATAFDAAARDWFGAVLLDLFRRTGLAAQERAAWLTRTRGPDAVLAEIDLLQGDWLRRQYFTALLKENLDAATVQRTLRKAGTTLKSDYDRAELLVAVADRFTLDGATRDAYLEAERGIGSDYDQRRVLTAVLTKGRLTSEQVAAVIDAAATVNSDYDRAELLIQVTGQDLSSAAARDAWLRATTGIRSDYDHRRVLCALLAREKLNATQMAMLLSSAKTIKSDFDLAEAAGAGGVAGAGRRRGTRPVHGRAGYHWLVLRLRACGVGAARWRSCEVAAQRRRQVMRWGHDLSRRERQIMDVIYERAEATVSEVLTDLPDPPSYSAVRAMLRKLEEKGHLTHDVMGPRYVYKPVVPRETVQDSALERVMRTFFNGSASRTVQAILDTQAAEMLR